MLKSRAIFKPLVLTAAVIVSQEENTQMSSKKCVCRRTELPIYSNSADVAVFKAEDHCPPEPSFIEEGVKKIRITLMNGYDQVEKFKRQSEDLFRTSFAKSEEVTKYLRQEDNTFPQVGAIAIGGLTGYILGIRGRFFKRTFYSLIGAGAVASLCYPNEARKYSQEGLTELKKYSTIAYNFAYGVKKGDPVRELPSLPKFPSSISEAFDMVTSFGKKTTTEISSPVSGDVLGKDGGKEVSGKQ